VPLLLLSNGVRLFGKPAAHPIQLPPQDFSHAGPDVRVPPAT
jgi:hypothetical protein